MEIRALLAIVLSIAVLAVFQYLFAPQMPPVGTNATDRTTIETEQALRKDENPTLSKLPDLPPSPKMEGKDIIVDTPLFKATLTETGGNFKEFILKKYKESLDENAKGVNLINVDPPLLPLGIKIAGDREIDLRNYFFRSDKNLIKLRPGNKETVTFTADLGNGANLIKRMTFHADTYLVDVDISITGAMANKYSVFLYDRPYKESTSYIFSGPSYYSQEKGLEEVKLDEPGQIHRFSGMLDWLSYGDNYFMIALLTESDKGPWDITITRLDNSGLTESRLSGTVSSKAIANGNTRLCSIKAYLGPKEIDTLKAVGHNLSEAINFGWFDPIAKPLLYVLNIFYKYMHNYGVAIIVLTVLIKVLFWPLAHKSAQSMKTMQKLQPKLQKLKEKYGDDKERLNKELMQLYRTYKVNPMSGCLPTLLQIPVFFALYKVLLLAIELRHAPFALWINDLSAPDRLMIPGVDIPILGGIPVLTILMGVSMYVQQQMNPSSIDPTMAKAMQLLPVVFTFIFINFPSGLVLYWLVNNVLSIVQQYYVNKFTD